MRTGRAGRATTLKIRDIRRYRLAPGPHPAFHRPQLDVPAVVFAVKDPEPVDGRVKQHERVFLRQGRGQILQSVVAQDVTTEELDALCLANIARFKRPKHYRFVGELPKSNYGKVLKTELRKLL